MDLYTASSLGMQELVEIEAKRNPINILKANKKGWTPIMYACIYCQERIVASLVNLVPSTVYSVNPHGQTPLMLAAKSGDLNIVKMLTKPGILQYTDDNGWTALFYAVYYGHLNIISYLITHGANVNARDNESRSILMRAIESGQENVIELLIAYGADCDLGTDSSNIQGIIDSQILHERHSQLLMLLNITTVTDLDSFLHVINLDEYSEFFKNQAIDLNQFLQLDESDLKYMGICKFGPRRKMALAVAKYNYIKDLKKDLQNNPSVRTMK